MVNHDKTTWVKRMTARHNKADIEVLEFIADFLYMYGYSKVEFLQNLFTKGYCYYFANMLQTAFNRGTICYAYPYDHIVWYDNGVAYDITGIYDKYLHLIDINEAPDILTDYKHLRNQQSTLSEQEAETELLKLVDQTRYVI